MPAADRSVSSLSRMRETARARARGLRATSTDAERARRQHPIGIFFADFACIEAMLVIELDGGQHFERTAMAYDADRWLTGRHPHPNPLPQAGEGVHTKVTS